MADIAVEAIGAFATDTVNKLVAEIREATHLPDHEKAAHAMRMMKKINALPEGMKSILIFETLCQIVELQDETI